MRKIPKIKFTEVLLVILSTLVYSLGLHIFINPANLYPAGFIGISKLLANIIKDIVGLELNFMIMYFAFQILLTVLVFKYLGRKFAVLTVIQYSLVSILGILIPNYQIVDDMILQVLFGGILGGLGSILALKAGASGGGTDFIAIYLQKKNPVLPIWDYDMYLNWTVLLISGILYGWEIALYSMVYQLVATLLINNMDSRQKLSGLYIITDQSDDVTEVLFKSFHRGITKLWGEGAYTKSPKVLLFMVVNTFEVNQVISLVRSVDEKAFINVTKSEQVYGNFKRQKIE